MSSVACHIFNEVNLEKKIYTENGQTPNMRTHVFFIAPPGFSKSFSIQVLLRGKESILGNTQIPIAFEQSMTEAGYVGTQRIIEGEVTPIFGAAFEHRHSIVGIDEFSSLTQAMKSEHSANLQNYLLTSLDDGNIDKRLAAGPMRYNTNLTVWGSTQPMRFDLTAGLARRFAFIYFIPSTKDHRLFKNARRFGRNTRADTSKLDALGRAIDDRVSLIKEIEYLSFDDSVLDLMDSLNIVHYEEKIYERIAFGIYCFTHKITKRVHVTVDDIIEKAITDTHTWRTEIKTGGREQIVIKVLSEFGMMTLDELISTANLVGISYADMATMIEALRKQRRITIWEDNNIQHVMLRDDSYLNMVSKT
jgi:hypothetical protein